MAEADGPPRIQITKMVVVPDVKDNVFRRIFLFDLQHTPIGLVNAVATDAIVSDRLLYMCCQILLPGLTVTDLVAVSEAVAISMDTTGSIRKVDDFAGPVPFIAVEAF